MVASMTFILSHPLLPKIQKMTCQGFKLYSSSSQRLLIHNICQQFYHIYNHLIVGLPGQAGFEFQCRSILGEKASNCTIASFESLPWACRISEFGKHAQILGFKETLGISFIVGKNCNLPFEAVKAINAILGEKPQIQVIQNYIAVNLMAKYMVHPPMMYGKWGNWDGKPLK